MVKRYLLSNVFICPSTIENSPNSLCEAQLLGVPHIASYVGGTADLMKGNEECLYRFEETEMLAEKSAMCSPRVPFPRICRLKLKFAITQRQMRKGLLKFILIL